MAKIIKCPTCQTPIEVPAQLTGQIVKCPGCGKGLKLVAKKPAGQQAPPQSPGGGLAGQSMSGSLSGQSVSAMTYAGEPPPLDDMPSLDSNCVVCGRATDPEELIEDNGRMVCPDCIKGARSRIDRPAGGAEMLGFKAPMPAPVRRGNIINISPSFLIGAVAALVLIGCQLYLWKFDKPVGTLTKPTQASLTKPGNTGDIFVDAAATTAPTETAPAESTTAPAATQPSATPTEVATVPPPVTPDPATKPAEPDTIFSDAATPPPTPPTDVPPVPAIPQPPVPPGAIATAANDPLTMGIEKLQLQDWAGAGRLLDQARTKYVLRKMGDKLTPEQQMTLVGLAAANLGQNNAQAAKTQLDIVMAKGTKTRSAVVNNAIAVASKRSSAKEIGDAIRLMQAYLAMQRGDEYAANIFGTLIDRASSMPGVSKEDKEQLARHVDFLDNYNDQLARDQHPGQLKWGTEWLQEDLVRAYRANRGKPANAVAAPPEQLKKDIEAAQAKVFQMQQAVNQAKSAGGDVVGAENQMNAALANLGRLQMQLQQAGAPPRAPVWLTQEKFAPVVPETVMTQ